MPEKASSDTSNHVSTRDQSALGDPFSTLKLFKAVDRIPNNLPIQLTPLIGRERELKQVCELLLRGDVRLITLTGSGGTGKTRLAVEIASSLLGSFPSGVFFVSLDIVTDANLVGSAIARTLGVSEQKGRTLRESLKDYFRERRLLLVLDNFEQVLAAASKVVELLSDCPTLKILVTSRAPLRIHGEHEFPVHPLNLPDLRRMPPAERLSEYAAVALFVQRAKAIEPVFAVTTENAQAIAEICTRVDGLPLALELAAARTRALSPEAMLKRLASRLELLTSGQRDLPERQRTLRNTIAWSYDLLDTQRRKLFRRLSTFAGNFSLEAAEAVCSVPGDLEGNIFEGLSHLVEANLLLHEKSNGESRFRMLETIREFANESLAASGESTTIMGAYAHFFLSLAENSIPELRGPKQTTWLAQLEREHDNMRAALRWLIENKESDSSLRFGWALWYFWYIRGYLAEGRVWLSRTLAETSPKRTVFRANVLIAAGALAGIQYDFSSARSFLEESLAIYKELGDTAGIASALNYLGNVARNQGDLEGGRRLHEQALAMFQELGDKWGTALVLNNLGVGARNLGDYDKARTLHQQSLELFRQLGDDRNIARQLINLGIIFERERNYDEAHRLFGESLSLRVQLGEKVGIAESLRHLGSLARRRGDHDSACRLLGQSIVISRELGNKEDIVTCLEEYAGCACMRGEAHRAARLLGLAEVMRETMHSPIPPAYKEDNQRVAASARSALGEDRFKTEWMQGRTMTLEQAITYVLSVDSATS